MTASTHNTIPRPPIVAVLGHIDHGKSTLLDYIRKSNNTAQEAGGITQHIAAYEVAHADTAGVVKKITFIDTPGHAAFGSTRSRGATIADVVILVVSAEDSVKEQTIEALKAIRESETPFIVAINKIDREGANPEKAMNDLAEHEVFLEGRGGDVPVTQISAKTGTGVDELLETVLLLAELQELTGNPEVAAEGVVIEAHKDAQKGIVGTLIITNGTLKKGMCVSAGKSIAPVRHMEDAQGNTITQAQFSTPIQLIGFDSIPEAGSPFQSFTSKQEATVCASAYTPVQENTDSVQTDEEGIVIPIVVKADTAGSVDAVLHEIDTLPHSEDITLKILRSDVGAINESDVKLLSGGDRGIIVGFNTQMDNAVAQVAERADIALGTFSIIYDLTKWLTEVVARYTPQKEVVETVGKAKVLKVFSQTKHKQVIGAVVHEGLIANKSTARILRRDEPIGEGKILELQEQKLPVEKVSGESQFGTKIESKTNIAVGDILEIQQKVKSEK